MGPEQPGDPAGAKDAAIVGFGRSDAFRMFRSALGKTPIGMVVTDVGSGGDEVTEVNDAFCAITGYEPADVLGRPITTVLDLAFDLGGADATDADNTGEHRLLVADGSTRTVQVHRSLVADGDEEARRAIWLVEDISERRAALDQLVWVALHDDLTGVANRTLLMDRLQVALERLRRRPESLVLLYVDLDRFKEINDRYGHSAGDAVLVEVARRMMAVVRPGDTVGRLGGDEFLVIGNDITDLRHARAVAERIGGCFAEPCRHGDLRIPVGASIGISLQSDGDLDPDRALRDADAALYRAKAQSRRSGELVSGAMHAFAGVAADVDLRRDLGETLEHGVMELRYQPVFDLRTSRVVAVEALARLVGADGQLLEPATFLGPAEDLGRMVEIGAWVLGEACRQQCSWQTTRPDPPRVAVNLSIGELTRADLLGHVARTVTEAECLLEHLIIEVDEPTLLGASDDTIEQLAELRGMGAQVALDDFGREPSSVARLAQLPIDRLKLDPVLVAGVDGDPRVAAVVGGIIALAHSLGWRTVAEGIETEAQERAVRALDCDEGQGFHLCEPLTAAALAGLLDRRLR